MIELLQTLTLKQILFLAGLLLYIAVIFIILLLPTNAEHRRTDQDEPTDISEVSESDASFLIEDAQYCTSKEPASPSSPNPESSGLFHKKSKPKDLWYL